MMRRFIDEGALVVAAARNGERLKKAVEPFGDKAMAITADVGEADDVERLFAAVDQRFGKLDVLINNAAIYDFYQLEEAPPERIRRTVHSNLLGPMLCIRAAASLMRKAGAGHVINVTSETVRNPYPYLTGYGATKAALENLSQGLRQELRPDNIKVTALRLGAMDDPERENSMDAHIAPKFMEKSVGAMAYSGATMMNFDTVVDATIEILTLASDTTFDFVELRPTL
jgi:NAD(P)-dependent dehydrogenase (short-subunit alcohol dehydrogenase family)